MSVAKYVVIGVAILAMSVAGYFAREESACRNLEDDYLNSVDIMVSDVILAPLAHEDQEWQSRAESRRKLAENDAKAALNGLYLRCGERRGQAAFRKGQSLMLGN